MSEIFQFDDNNIPSNSLFGDTYYSKLGGLEETKKVFIEACEIDKKIKTEKFITIGETGFGTGLNFLATLKEFQENAIDGAVLQFFTFEKFLMPPEVAARAHQNFPEIATQSAQLLAKWPPNVSGLHSIEISNRVFLNIFIGDANQTIMQCDFRADAWFLDGFAPSKNPDFWSETILNQIANLTKPDGIIATYSVAAMVRDGLTNAGFEYEKLEGFANKKHRLIARPKNKNQTTNQVINYANKQSILIIGGGIAGLSCAYYAKKFGLSPIVFDNDLDGAIKASNNPRGICMPRLDRLDTTESRLFKTAYIHALNFYDNLQYGIERTQIKEPAKSDRDIEKFRMFQDSPPLPSQYFEIFDDYLLHNAALIEPPIVCNALSAEIEIRHDNVHKIENIDGYWHLFDQNNNILQKAKNLIIAAGAQINSFLDNKLPLSGREGVVSIANMEWPQNEMPIASGGYAIPFENKTLFGATFEPVELETIPVIRKDSHQRNLDTIAKFAPELAADLAKSELIGRASMRVVTKDVLPIAGKIDDGLFILGALGSRGFSLAPFLSQMIVSKIMGQASPIETAIEKIVSPNRFGN